MLKITVTDSKGSQVLTDVSVMTDVYLDVMDSETPGTLAYKWEHGGCFDSPRAKNSGVECQGEGFTEHAFNAIDSAHNLGWFHGMSDAMPTRSNAQVRRVDFSTLPSYMSGYESVSEGLADTTTLTDDCPTLVGTYQVAMLRHGISEKCECAEWSEHVGQMVDRLDYLYLVSSVCGLCGAIWRELPEDEQTEQVIGRWSHVFDGHVDEQATFERWLPGNNPRWERIANANRQRRQRYASLLSKVDSMPVSDVLSHYRTAKRNAVTEWRNAGIARLLGFRSTPRGRWPGVRFDDSLGSLIREYPDVIGGSLVTVKRFPDMTEIPLTRAQCDHVTSELNARYEQAQRMM